MSAKNFLNLIIGLCVTGLACIPIFVSPEHLARLTWRSATALLAFVAIFTLSLQAVLQSREDKGREKREIERDKRIEELVRLLEPKVTAIAPSQGLREKVLQLGHDLLDFLKGAPKELTIEEAKNRNMSARDILSWGMRERGPYVERIHYGYLSQFKDRTLSLFHELQARGIDVSDIQEWELNPPQVMRAETVRKIAEECFLIAARMDIKEKAKDKHT